MQDWPLSLVPLFLGAQLFASRAAAQPEPIAPRSQAPEPVPLAPTGGAEILPVAAPCLAPPEPNFGDEGEMVVSGLFDVSLGHLGYSASNASTTSASIEPAADYFIRQNVSLGGSLFVRYSDVESAIGLETKSFAVGAFARLGGNVPLGGTVSFRPVVSLGVWRMRSTYSSARSGYITGVGGTAVPVGPASDITETVVVGSMYFPLLIHPARHFFIGLGPEVYSDLSHRVEQTSNQRTFVGASSTVGGWF